MPGVSGQNTYSLPIDDKTAADTRSAADTSIWKTIRLGTDDSATSLRAALRQRAAKLVA